MKKERLTASQKLAKTINLIPNKFQTRLISSFTNKKNFDAFEKSPVQRPITESNVCTIMKSLKEYGTGGTNITIIRTSAFGKKNQLIIGDGQHTIKAAILLVLGLNGRIVELIDDTEENVLKYIAVLNNARKGWSNNVYLSEYSKLKSQTSRPYQIFDDLMKQHKLTVTDLSYIFLGGGSKKEVDMFKNGDLQFINEADSNRMLKAVLMVKDYIPNKSFARRSLYKVMRMTSNYEKFAQKIITSNVAFSENENEFYNQLVFVNKMSALVKA